MRSKSDAVPQPWPSLPLFIGPYRYKKQGVDRRVVYELTESPKLPLSIEEAAAIGDIDLIRRLIGEGVKVEAFDSLSFMTPLHRAAMEGQKSVVELLLAEGAPINERAMDLRTPLYHAVYNGHKEIVELLISKGADLSAACLYLRDGRPRTPLDIALDRDNREIIKLLLDNGAKE